MLEGRGFWCVGFCGTCVGPLNRSCVQCMSVPVVRERPGSVASEVASVCQWLARPRLGVVAEGSSVARGVGSTLVPVFPTGWKKRDVGVEC